MSRCVQCLNWPLAVHVLLPQCSCLDWDCELRPASNRAHAAEDMWHSWFHVHLKKGFFLSNQMEVTANKSSTPFLKEDFEVLAALECLQVQML